MGRFIDEDDVLKWASDWGENERLVENIKKLSSQEVVKPDNELAAFEEWVTKEFVKTMIEHGSWEYSETLEGVIYTIDEYCKNQAKKGKNDKDDL